MRGRPTAVATTRLSMKISPPAPSGARTCRQRASTRGDPGTEHQSDGRQRAARFFGRHPFALQDVIAHGMGHKLIRCKHLETIVERLEARLRRKSLWPVHN